jgi:hypothetical protein
VLADYDEIAFLDVSGDIPEHWRNPRRSPGRHSAEIKKEAETRAP